MDHRTTSRAWTHNMLIRIALSLLLATPAGCARFNSIYRGEALPDRKAHLVAIDAKQRVILSSPARRSTGSDEDRAILHFCAEPSPDVFAAISSSFGLRAALGTEKARQDISADLQQAMSENAATIARTQTTNILREMMYRNCERYLSGAIDEQEFIVQAARDQRAIVHVLAIEQLTGAARTQAVALTSMAKTASSGVSSDSIQALQTSFENKQSLEKVAALARKNAEDLSPAGACQSGVDAYSDTGADKGQIEAKNKACSAAVAADGNAAKAAEHYAAIQKSIERQSSLSTEASGEFARAATASSTATKDVADAVVRIVAMNNDFNEVEMTCIVLFRNLSRYVETLQAQQSRSRSRLSAEANDFDAARNADAFSGKCLAYLQAKIDMQRETNELQSKEAELKRLQIESQINALITSAKPKAMTVWGKVATDNAVDPTKLDALAKAAKIALPSYSRTQMLAANSLEEFATAFAGLIERYQSALAKAAAH
jgi:hypothetical protein